MKYPELTGVCKECLGCNLLEIPFLQVKQNVNMQKIKKL